MSDTALRYATVARDFTAVVDATPPDRWSLPSPCEEWTARDVLAHVVNGHRRLLSQLRGEEPLQLGADEDGVAAWHEATDGMNSALADEANNSRVVQSGMGPLTLTEMVNRFIIADLLVHTWDLARAVGGNEHLNDELVAQVYEAMKPMDEALRRPVLFGPKVEPPKGADRQTEFLSFLARRV